MMFCKALCFWLVSIAAYVITQIALLRTQLSSAGQNTNFKMHFMDTFKAKPLQVPSNKSDNRDKGKEASRLFLKNLVQRELIKQEEGGDYTVPFTPGAFIHLGKSGGSTLSKFLKNGCFSFVPKPCNEVQNLHQVKGAHHPIFKESPLSLLTTYFHTPDFRALINQRLKRMPTYPELPDYSFYTFTSRDPYDRAISAFLYTMPNKQLVNRLKRELEQDKDAVDKDITLKRIKKIKLELKSTGVNEAYKCFPTLDSFAFALGTKPTDYNSNINWIRRRDDCSFVAHLAVQGKVEPMEHLFWNLQKLVHNIPGFTEDKPVMVIRQEYMWQDWPAVNELLGLGREYQSENTDIHARQSDYRSRAQRRRENSLSSDDLRSNVCSALEKEYRVYFDLLKRAVNLKDIDIISSLEIAKRNCPMLNLKL
ncbi:hypothetical protein CTEN210_14803 [Chaetoceros tenuissimus]|uniref:Uncharacterized protein n=1 Tax=Chaetoceros tenuissimus TaxID=426638 RepID=A0AAD3D6E4_9STRA|nr:hypothetical protein CTEN210_14803 [Chaetoceros tenuissimus]